MTKEPLSAYLALNMTPAEKRMLVSLAEGQRTTMSSVLRGLIRRAAQAQARAQAKAVRVQATQEGDGSGGSN